MIVRLTKRQKINDKYFPEGKVMAVEKWLGNTLACEVLEEDSYDFKNWKTTETLTESKKKKNESKDSKTVDEPEG